MNPENETQNMGPIRHDRTDSTAIALKKGSMIFWEHPRLEHKHHAAPKTLNKTDGTDKTDKSEKVEGKDGTEKGTGIVRPIDLSQAVAAFNELIQELNTVRPEESNEINKHCEAIDKFHEGQKDTLNALLEKDGNYLCESYSEKKCQVQNCQKECHSDTNCTGFKYKYHPAEDAVFDLKLNKEEQKAFGHFEVPHYFKTNEKGDEYIEVDASNIDRFPCMSNDNGQCTVAGIPCPGRTDCTGFKFKSEDKTNRTDKTNKTSGTGETGETGKKREIRVTDCKYSNKKGKCTFNGSELGLEPNPVIYECGHDCITSCAISEVKCPVCGEYAYPYFKVCCCECFPFEFCVEEVKE